MFLRRACTLALALALPVAASAWWNEAWSDRKTITVDTSAQGANLTAPLENATVLLRLHQGNFPGFLTVRDGGADFRLVAGDDQTPLSYHVEMFDPVTQMALIWVRKPVINPQSTSETLYLYFGNPEAVPGGDAPATFDAQTVAAFHFDETAGLPADSSSYQTAVTSGEVFANPSSIVGHGATLPGTEPLVLADAGPLALVPEQGWTFSSWMKIPEAPAEPAYLLDRRDGEARLSLVLSGQTITARHAGAEIASAAPITPGQWHHVGLTVGSAQMQLFLDGQQVASAPVTPQPLSGPVAIGGALDGSGVIPLDLDELRISATARSATWLGFAAAIQGERNDALITYGAAEEGEGGHAAGGHGGGHFATIWNNVFGPGGPMVERIVIIICGLMMVIAVAVIFFKALLLSRARRATNAFEKAFKRLKIGATNPDEGFAALAGRDKRFGDSPLYQVYKVAVEQVEARSASPSVGAHAAGLDSKTIKTIQAAMDSKMVRESQRMNAWMVLLTIAISGGPFIGLLGTVVGVMTTFGAIAATGDINITAIAPGMAAALLATVAGLGVAIPALFGYNYLGSKIKELSADMSVFADELTARVTEEFGA